MGFFVGILETVENSEGEALAKLNPAIDRFELNHPPFPRLRSGHRLFQTSNGLQPQSKFLAVS